MSAHEELRRTHAAAAPSERSFGFVFAAVFAIAALLPLIGRGEVRSWALGVAAAFLVTTLAAPKLLRPLNRVWFLFGELLHRVVAPVATAAVYYLVFTPLSLLARPFARDPLRLRPDRAAATYWIDRPRDRGGSMADQF
jgi:hypothetical protein